jgi:hypothetical protein
VTLTPSIFQLPKILQDEMVQLQNMEAETLCAMQTWENGGQTTPLVEVKFAFSSIFDDAKQCLPNPKID